MGKRKQNWTYLPLHRWSKFLKQQPFKYDQFRFCAAQKATKMQVWTQPIFALNFYFWNFYFRSFLSTLPHPVADPGLAELIRALFKNWSKIISFVLVSFVRLIQMIFFVQEPMYWSLYEWLRPGINVIRKLTVCSITVIALWLVKWSHKTWNQCDQIKIAKCL